MSQLSPNAAAAPGLVIEPFEGRHLDGALRLSQAEGWPHRAEDWALSLSFSNGVVAMQQGRVVGTALCTAFGDVASMNMIIVASDLRGHGLGRKLMLAAMGYAKGRALRLIATEAGKPLYEKLGFHETGRIFQHQGIAQALDVPQALGMPQELAADLPVTVYEPGTGAEQLDALAAMDLDASGMERRVLLAEFARQGVVLCASGGFAVLRDFGRGTLLGPVVAQDSDTARALIAAGASHAAGRFVRIDLTDPALVPLAESLGLAQAGGGTAMAKDGAETPAHDHKTFALASQALG